ARVTAFDWVEATDRSRDAGILVNATTLGMRGAEGVVEVDLTAFNAQCVVADLVYVPLVTPLLAAAKARGLVTVDGLGMLLHQAAPGFEKWFGVRPLVTNELRALLIADIERH
ncbi:MAG TPA: shikimate dehydrogenase, partial [Hyphomicrobiaceae bacterium]|nr:shikimate dehydrogenase [Hyphomicrobiaceae bacterium]